MRYELCVRSVVEEWVIVEADSKTEARDKARDPSQWVEWEEGSRVIIGPWPSKTAVMEAFRRKGGEGMAVNEPRTDPTPHAGENTRLRQSLLRVQCGACGKWLCQTLEGRPRRHKCK